MGTTSWARREVQTAAEAAQEAANVCSLELHPNPTFFYKAFLAQYLPVLLRNVSYGYVLSQEQADPKTSFCFSNTKEDTGGILDYFCEMCEYYPLIAVHGHYECPQCHYKTKCCEGAPQD